MNDIKIAEEKGLKDVLVFQVCESQSVASYSSEEALKWYEDLTGLSDELYTLDEIEVVPFEKVVWNGEEKGRRITVREIVDYYWDGEPFIVTTEI